MAGAGIVGGLFGGDDAGDASVKAAKISAGAQQDALDYLKEQDALPSELRTSSLGQLAGLYGLDGGTTTQDAVISDVLNSPLYSALMSGQEAGEEAILRNAAATGGLRSGNVQESLYDYNTQLQNQTLLDLYNERLAGLQGLSGLSTNTNQIANTMSGIGSTLAQGTVASAQAEQQASQNSMNTLLGLGSMAAMAFSDRRLKKDIKKVGEIDGKNWYTWTWNTVAEKMGMKGKSEGVMADEIYRDNPDCVKMFNGFMVINYTKLGIM